MLTKVTAYSQWVGEDPLVLNVINHSDTDLFEVRNIDGLGAVKADVNTTPLGSVKGSALAGTNVAERNLVFTLGLDPDWDEWTVSRLRRFLDKYFMPEQQVRFELETMEFSPVEIFGVVESNEPNMFSKDPEQVISVICPEPDFVALDETVVEGTTDMFWVEDWVDLPYEGNVETGINVEVTKVSGSDPTSIGIETSADDLGSYPGWFITAAATPVTTDTKKFIVNSMPGDKYAHNVTISSGVITNRLNDMWGNSKWQTMRPGSNKFAVITDTGGIQSWILKYKARFGSL